jgi:hypothetical protein
MMAPGPTAAVDTVRLANTACPPQPPRFTPEETAIEIDDDDDDPADPLTPSDLWY